MNYPKKLYIGHEVYKIKFVKKFKDSRQRGECDSGKKQITVLEGMSKRSTITTLVHEVLHAIEFEGGFPIKHKTIYGLETALYELYLDNFT